MRVRTLGAALALSLLSISLTVTPAYANDATLTIDRGATAADPDARAHWDDLTDNLCVRALTGTAKAFFRRPHGDLVTVVDRPGGGNTCSGNLSIGEDFYTQLYLHHIWNGSAEQKTEWFYT